MGKANKKKNNKTTKKICHLLVYARQLLIVDHSLNQ